MRIKLKTTYAGPDGTGNAGDIVDVLPKLAHAMIAGGYAEAVDKPRALEPEPPAEAAAIDTDADERTTLPISRRRRRG